MSKIVNIVLPVVFSASLLCVSCNQEEEGSDDSQQYKGIYESGLAPSGDLIMDASNLEFTVYLPQDYKESGKKYPVLYLFHGVIDDHTAWQEKGGVVEMTDKAIRDGVIEPFIIVMPNAFLSFYVDGFWLLDGRPGHKYETCFFTKLMPYIEANYPVMTDRQHTAIAGISMGGYGASLYAFKYPERFCMAYSMSGATQGLDWIWSEDDDDLVPSIEKIFIDRAYDKDDFDFLPAYFMDCGSSDPICKRFNDSTHEFLTFIEFPHAFREFEGTHSWSYWIGCYRRMLPDLAERFNRH